eukprot:14193345-Alexandrium_andersonii.AAC.1
MKQRSSNSSPMPLPKLTRLEEPPDSVDTGERGSDSQAARRAGHSGSAPGGKAGQDLGPDLAAGGARWRRAVQACCRAGG